MPEIIKSIVLGIIQGLTEFLPVSSSGHLELAKYFLGTDFTGDESLTMSVVLHIATALSTFFVFRKEILSLFSGVIRKGWNEDKTFLLQIVISMIPAAIIGYFFEKELEQLFSGKIFFVSCMLILTGILLFVSDYGMKREKDISNKHSLIIGIAQAIAILPGISRSGATISTSVLLGIKKEKAAFFSFIMVLPLIFGKMAKDVLDGAYTETTISHSSLIFGFLAAFITGIIACKWMITLVKNSKLRYFAYYCVILGLTTIIILYFNGN
ncbi:MAG: undecaprenyl-diphosphate phosphatase [Saprospiraceae bacterium]|nr:undecaprenyl-diphosphate phosphatase [Saprospiraceae bacterium]